MSLVLNNGKTNNRLGGYSRSKDMDDASPHRLDEELAVTSEGRGDQPGLRPSDCAGSPAICRSFAYTAGPRFSFGGRFG